MQVPSADVPDRNRFRVCLRSSRHPEVGPSRRLGSGRLHRSEIPWPGKLGNLNPKDRAGAASEPDVLARAGPKAVFQGRLVLPYIVLL